MKTQKLFRNLGYVPVARASILEPNLYFVLINVQRFGQVRLVITCWVLLVLVQFFQLAPLLRRKVDSFFSWRSVIALVILLALEWKFKVIVIAKSYLRQREMCFEVDALQHKAEQFHCDDTYLDSY